MKIRFINRTTGREETEKVYGDFFIRLFYGTGWSSSFLAFLFLPLIAHVHFFSWVYGAVQKSRLSRKKIGPFIRAFGIDETEFLEPTSAFSSFNDFFIRKLKPSCRPFVAGEDRAILPADGRYLVFPNMQKEDGFLIKGAKFSLEELLQDRHLALKYAQGSLMIARLCPIDYHRFHFPCAGTPDETKQISGPLFSVNPLALKKNIDILVQNKRAITPFHTECFGTILYIEVGATYVGTIHQTFVPKKPHDKGAEKGYFSFGGSCLLLLFEPERIQFDQDLLEASARKIEMRGLLGQSLGIAL